MEKVLTPYDKTDIKSGTVRWQKSAEWEVHSMRKEGLIEIVSKSGEGMWRLTLGGERMAKALRRVTLDRDTRAGRHES